MSSHAHHSILVTRGSDPRIVALQVELASLKELLAEKDRSAERERQDQKATRDKAEEAVNARLDALNALKQQRIEDRTTFATREKVDTNTEEIGKVRAHVHDIGNDLTAVMNKPPQFGLIEEKGLHEVAEWWLARRQTTASRGVELWKAGVTLICMIIVIHILPNIGHVIRALIGA